MLKASVTLPHFSAGEWNPTQDPRWLQGQSASMTPSANPNLSWKQATVGDSQKSQRGGTPAWSKCRRLDIDIADLSFPLVDALDYSLSPLYAADSGLPSVEISNVELRLKDATAGLRHLFNNLSLLVSENAPKIQGLEAIVLQCKSICSTVTQGNIECFSILSSFRMKQLHQEPDPQTASLQSSSGRESEEEAPRRGRALDDATLNKLDALLKILESGGSTSVVAGKKGEPIEPEKAERPIKGRVLPKPMSPSSFGENKEMPKPVPNCNQPPEYATSRQDYFPSTPPGNASVASTTPTVSPVTSDDGNNASSRKELQREPSSDISPLSSISSLSCSSETEEATPTDKRNAQSSPSWSCKPRTPQEALRGYGFLRTRDSKGVALLTPRSRIRKRRIQRR